ncbi:MAG: diguanylate cyclase [Syntrophales bacterium]|nr:diguanylate cyclase [Syntrophales bacterium]
MEKKVRILVVEDERVVGEDIARILRKFGYDVLAIISSGEEAVKIVEDVLPDLVFMDIMLEGDMNGIDAAGQICSRFDIPVVCLTAYGDEDRLHKAKKTGLSGYMLKPFEERDLYNSVEMALYKHKMEKALRDSEEKYRGLVENISEIIYSLDENAVVTYISPNIESFSGYSPSEIIGKRFTEFIYEKDLTSRTNKLQEIVSERKEVTDFRFLTRSGESRWLRTTGRPILKDNRVMEVRGTLADITDRKLVEEELVYMATHDQLTGLSNRALFNDRLAVELARARRNPKKLAVMLLDLDEFKEINDTFGHSFGDRLLKAVGKCLSGLLRESDTVARMGGDEFLLLLSEVVHVNDVANIAEKIIDAFQKPLSVNGHELNITTSLGIAVYPEDGQDADTLIKNADIAMYNVKKHGRNGYRLYSSNVDKKGL